MTDGIFVRRRGQGMPAVLVVHGLGVDHSLLLRTHEPLDLPGTFIYFDLPGCGRSPDPEDWNAVTHGTFVQAIDRVRAEQDLERAIVYGHSYGCALALEYALAHPSRVAGLILCDGGPAMDHLEHSLALARTRSRNGEYDALMQFLTNPPQTHDDIASFWRACLPLYVESRSVDDLLECMSECVYRPQSFNYTMGTLAPLYDVRARLHEIECPVLLISGRHDWIHPIEYQAAVIHERLPHSQLIVMERSGTLPFFDEPERYREVVSEWLARHISEEAVSA